MSAPAAPRVLFVTPILEYPPRGGAPLRIYNTIRALSRVCALSLYSYVPRDDAGGEVAERHLQSICQFVQFRRTSPITTARRSPRGVLERLRSRLGAYAAIAQFARRNGVEVIWLGYGNVAYYFLVLKLLTHCKIVVDTDSVHSRFVLRELPLADRLSDQLRILRDGLLKRLEEVICTNVSDLTTAVSEVDAAYYRRISLHPQKVDVLPNVVDTTAYTTGDPASRIRPSVCLSGTIGERGPMVDAAFWLLDHVMPLVWRDRPDVHLYIVGRDPAARLLERSSERVTVVPSPPSVVPYLRAASAALVPLRYESGTRFKILEAFASRIPVVSTTLGAEGLDVVDGEHLLIADAPDEFASAIQRLLAGSGLADRLVEAGSRLVESQYSLAAAERHAARVLRRVLGGDAGP